MDVKNYYDDWITKFGEKEILAINKKFNYTPSSKLYLVPKGYLLNLISNLDELHCFLIENAKAIEEATIFPQYQELWRMYKLRHNQNLNIFDIVEDVDEEEIEETPEEISKYLNQSLFSADPILIKLNIIETQIAETLGITKINSDSSFSRQSYYILKELLNTKKDENAVKAGGNSIIIGKLEKIENHLTKYHLLSPQPTKSPSLLKSIHSADLRGHFIQKVSIVLITGIIIFILYLMYVS